MAAEIVQYIIVRGDLKSKLKWPIGALIAQACHASTAVMHLNRSDPTTARYLDDLDRMHKVVLQTDDEASLVRLSQELGSASVVHKLWMEQPENVPTCIALKPYRKEDVQSFFSNLKLLR